MANTISFTNGVMTTTGGEDILFDVQADKYFATWIFTHNMSGTDSITVKIYSRDENAGVLRLYISEPITGPQTSPAYYLHLVPTTEYRVSLTRTAGTDRAYTWLRAEI